MVEPPASANPTSPARPFQFSLKQLLVALFILCTLLGAYSTLGMTGVTLWVAAAGLFGVLVGTLQGNWRLGLSSVLVAGMICVVVPPDRRGASPRAGCMHHLSEIGQALHQYHVINGSFPPAYVPDESGRPIHSWRTLILPYLSYQSLYDQYDFSQPWNGPENSHLANVRLDVFRCPTSSPSGVTTNYLTVTGPGTAWPGAVGSKLSDFDDPSETILVVEVVGADIPWAEPRDLEIDSLKPAINDRRTFGISSRHRGGANVLMADGKVRFLTNDVLAAKLRTMLAPQAGAK